MYGRTRRRILQVALVSVLAVGCGSDGGDEESTGSNTAGGETAEKTSTAPGLELPGDGPVLLADDEGKLSVVEPGGGPLVAIEAPPIDDQERGVAGRAPGIAFFKTSEGELLQVDAIGRTAKVVGNLEDAGGDLAYGNNGGGRRFVAFTSQYGRQGIVVDIHAGVTRPVSELLPPEDRGSSLGTVRISSNEQHLFAEADDQVRLLSLAGGLAAAGAGTTIPGSKAFFNADGTALFVGESVPGTEPSRERVKRIPLDGAAEELVLEGADIFLGIAGDAALTREGNVYTLTSHPGNGRTVDLGITEGELAAMVPSTLDGTGLVTILNEKTDKRRYVFLDPKDGSPKPLDALEGFQRMADPKDRFELFANFRLQVTGGLDDPGGDLPVGKGTYAILDTMTGTVTTASFDVGSHKQNPQPFSSPDGTRVAISASNDKNEPRTAVVSFAGKKTTETDAGFSTWSPSGKTFLVRRFVPAETALHHFVVENGKEREIAAGRLVTIVWTSR